MASDHSGLGEIWGEIVSAIETLSIKGCYERVNRVVSLGLLNRLRRRTASLVGGEILLDAGSGPGTSTAVLAGVHPSARILMLDPSGPMLRHAMRVLQSGRVQPVQGRFEAIPLAENSVDGIVAMFSFRDAVNYEEALREMHRVLRPGGSLAILDFYRPVQPWRALVKLYLIIMVPIALLLSRCGSELSLYRGFLHTIDRMLGLRELIDMLNGIFGHAGAKRIAPGLMIAWAVKSQSQASS